MRTISNLQPYDHLTPAPKPAPAPTKKGKGR